MDQVMEITEVRITLMDDPKLRAFATITINGDFVVRGLKVIEGRTGTFVAMPARKLTNGEWQDIAHPINNEAREILESAVLSTYRDELGSQKDGAETESG
jgi:stage V sporulation protein G